VYKTGRLLEAPKEASSPPPPLNLCAGLIPTDCAPFLLVCLSLVPSLGQPYTYGRVHGKGIVGLTISVQCSTTDSIGADLSGPICLAGLSGLELIR